MNILEQIDASLSDFRPHNTREFVALQLARRFNDLVGEPPMSFLTGWRIALAADLLLEPGATIGSVAHEVGYGSPFALSTAFKRLRGVSPQQYRSAAT